MDEQHKILVVDDEPDILQFIRYNLEKEGYHVFEADSGEKALELVRSEEPDLILLDIMMPGLNGIETCRLIRENGTIRQPLIAFLSARGEEFTQVAGFDAGADDYITKPIKPRLLVSRLKALLRRNRKTESTRTLETCGFCIDRDAYLVRKGDNQWHLPRKEFELLYLLASRPGRVFTRDEIMHRVWGDEVIVGERTLDVHIRRLRQKLGNDLIKTVKGVGYKLEAS